jgi:ABC-type nitrate/sulfonate/bicarbonate transport system substrate-binding protein
MNHYRSTALPFKLLAGNFAFIGLFAVVFSAAVKSADLLPLVVYAEPGVDNDSLWMADAKGYLKAEGLAVQMRLFPSGTTAMQTFRTGAGDILFGGDLPGLQYWQRGNPYRIIAPIERDAGGYVVVADKAVKSAKDLVGKTVATRVGSTGSYFVAEDLFEPFSATQPVRWKWLFLPQSSHPTQHRGWRASDE